MISWVSSQVITVDSSPESGGPEAFPFSPFEFSVDAQPAESRFPTVASIDAQPAESRFPTVASIDAQPAESRFPTVASIDAQPAESRFPTVASIDAQPAESRFPTVASMDSIDKQHTTVNGELSAQVKGSGIDLPRRGDPEGSPRIRIRTENPSPSGPVKVRAEVKGGAGRGGSLPVVEHPSEQVINVVGDAYVAGHDVIVNLAAASRSPEGGDVSVLDEHQSLYLVRPFGSGSGADGTSVGMVSPGGDSSVSVRDQARTRPALMLGGHAAVTTFVGRATELARLSAWYERPGRVSAMLVHGAVGQGKTRLTREFARLAAPQDERVVVRETIPLTEVSQRMIMSKDESSNDGRRAKPTDLLLLVDEADFWPAHKLRKLLRDMDATSYRQIRLLLTGRAATDWWPALVASLSPGASWEDLALEVPHPAELRRLAIAAANSHAARLEWDEPPPLPEEVWQQLDGCPPLSVELMVLARMHAAEAGWPVPETLREAAEVALRRELLCWEHMHGTTDPVPGSGDYRIRLDPRAMRRAVYAATLTGPLGKTAARRVVDLAGLGCALDSQQVIDDHARCYPAAGSQYLAGLPTCLAEEFLGLLVPDPSCPSGTPLRDSWALDTPFHILDLLDPQERKDEEATRDSTASAGLIPGPSTPHYSKLTFGPQHKPLILRLTRAAARWPHLAEQQLYPLAEHYPRVLVSVEGVWSELLNIKAEPSDKAFAALDRAVDEILPKDSQEWLNARDTLRQLAERKNPPAANC